MPALPPRRPSLCLFCAFASPSRARPSPRAFLPRAFLPRAFLPQAQVAPQTGGATRRILSEREHFKDRQRVRWVGSGDQSPPQHGAKKFRKPGSVLDRIRDRLYPLRLQFETPEHLKSLDLTPKEFEEEWIRFEKSVGLWIRKGSPEINSLADDVGRGQTNIDTRLRYLFHAQIIGQRFTQAELENQKELADLRWPTEWYPATREIHRTVHLHVGPTNSGKTYHALKRLEDSDSGIYLGPLRLLAHEVYTRLNAKDKPCALVTGEEQRVPEGVPPQMWSCTVEMAPMNQQFDVAVIDEIQMINHQERGWAWTQAFLGVRAKEIHLCGEARTVPLIRELCALIGDSVVVHDYERLTPLRVSGKSLNGNLSQLQKGDCVVVFSVLGIHALRRQIEQKTGRKCAMVYGSLPPETRAQQARLFNDPDNDYDYLVASDAIGMGLNLAVKRIIFESTVKNNGSKLVPLAISDVKQIAGRAGRYRTAHQDVKKDLGKAVDADDGAAIGLEDQEPPKPENTTVGYATTLEAYDHAYLRSCMGREPEPIKTAGLFPPSLIIERFSNYFPPGTPFSYILLRLHEISNINSSRFHLCALKDQLNIADTIHEIRNLTTQERLTFCAAPTNCKEAVEKDFLRVLARCVANNESGSILDLDHLPLEILDEQMSAKRDYLRSLESLHKQLVLYLWLSYRFPNVFTTRGLANHAKALVEERIEETLKNFNYTQEAQRMIRKARRAAIKELETTPEETSAAGNAEQQLADVVKKNDPLETEPGRDDTEEYPTLELEEDEVIEDMDAQEQQHEKYTRGLEEQVEEVTHRPVTSIDLGAETPNATQARA
ncbi:P-loop containing nucleoside triphosphate hydrolase protein [Lophiotrema nucula]|uniref:RNA helicase n=1 Tax=Lophiotrema nucula TaxID=690887 RepID=A0A6A5ZRH5_9PLEO|nr:P-loop containing nucleoside triphosphate hydrolase protein [Lophiotrema nucula]